MGQCSVVLDALTAFRSLYSEPTMVDTSSWCSVWPSSCPLWIASHALSDAVRLCFSPPGDIGVSKQPHISSFTKPVPNHDVASARSRACSSDSAGAFGAPRSSSNSQAVRNSRTKTPPIGSRKSHVVPPPHPSQRVLLLTGPKVRMTNKFSLQALQIWAPSPPGPVASGCLPSHPWSASVPRCLLLPVTAVISARL
ncbi:hypothetical protein BDP55DRAFT_1591 [Colletotrichum godetiae]|uniref:Uncharacterized protein n=1 Tax=Colletotrichum godetiae TaxID=1209918 RepID=A0AAJ0B1R0_9PEZI|nr:uncharacterized protein BDP55DRAFT_1591 [Colletotrichum godetiae]KAK1700840.1 hypothetical protein BDP55DRAFT_1591 [Colletotrichum godetiae]